MRSDIFSVPKKYVAGKSHPVSPAREEEEEEEKDRKARIQKRAQ